MEETTISPMSDEQWEAIGQRGEYAAAGPWQVVPVVGSIVSVTGEIIVQGDVGGCGVLDVNDAQFIAHAREDIRMLRAEVEWQRTRANGYAQAAQTFKEWNDELRELVQYLGAFRPMVFDVGDWARVHEWAMRLLAADPEQKSE